MADNMTQASWGAGDIVRADDIAGVKHPGVKINWGPDGTVNITSAANPIPVNTNAKQELTYILSIDRLVNTALAANTTRQQVSFEHSAASTKTVKIRRIHIGAFNSTAVAGDLRVMVDYGTAASSAGTAATGQTTLGGDAAHECTIKTLPTITAATRKFTGWIGAPTAAIQSVPGVTTYDWQEAGQTKPLTLRAGVLESLVVGIQSFAANVYHVTGFIIFTEE